MAPLSLDTTISPPMLHRLFSPTSLAQIYEAATKPRRRRSAIRQPRRTTVKKKKICDVATVSMPTRRGRWRQSEVGVAIRRRERGVGSYWLGDVISSFKQMVQMLTGSSETAKQVSKPESPHHHHNIPPIKPNANKKQHQ
ncbi:hypothetical protein PIB30_055252 [Stylosanthes scabra]|uniref:VQ domain-containing protein n=1 Tax=Stylosanthes scabra TaxID=79078 RepID=A0ABU6XGT5_9FABA|nr:hypothetical protein [Stylosanthes scabra]